MQASRRVVIFVMAHDDSSMAVARGVAAKYAWATPVKLPNEDSPLFESRLFVDFDRLCGAHVGPETEYVGQVSYKVGSKANLPQIDAMIRSGKYEQCDYVHLVAPGVSVKASRFACSHPQLQALWAMHIAPQTLPAEQTPEVFFNFWLARRGVHQAYRSFVTALAPALLADQRTLMDARYRNGSSQAHLMRLCGVPHFPHTPFVLERLPPAFFLSRGFACASLANGKLVPMTRMTAQPTAARPQQAARPTQPAARPQPPARPPPARAPIRVGHVTAPRQARQTTAPVLQMPEFQRRFDVTRGILLKLP